MAMFFFILGIVIIAFALFCFLYMSFSDYCDEEMWAIFGTISIIVGIFMTAGGAVFVFYEDTPTSPKQEETLRTETVDSLGVITEKDSVYAIRFIIYGKEGNRISVGGGTVLEGYTNKSLGDTITINLK